MTVEERVSVLEKNLRQWKVATGVMLVLAVGVAWVGWTPAHQQKGAPGSSAPQSIVQAGLEALGIRAADGKLEARELTVRAFLNARYVHANSYVVEDETNVLGEFSATNDGGLLQLVPKRKAKGDNTRFAILFTPNGPALSLADKDGIRANLGASELVNPGGSTEMTSAASLVFFDKKGRVTWRFPLR